MSLTVSRMRNSLSNASTRASTVLGSWPKVPGLLPDDEILKLLKKVPVLRETSDTVEIVVLSDD